MGCCRSRQSPSRDKGENSQADFEDVNTDTIEKDNMDEKEKPQTENGQKSTVNNANDVTTKPSNELPPPRPYRKSKKDLIPDVKEAFGDIDSHADKAPERDNLEALANYLFKPDRPGRMDQSDT